MRNARFLTLGSNQFAIARVRGDSRESVYTFAQVRTWSDAAGWGEPTDYDLGVAALFACDLFGGSCAVLFETGEIDLAGTGRTERIVEVGKRSSERMGGYLLTGKQFGNDVVVTGYGGQTYVSRDGARWRPFISKLFNPPAPPRPYPWDLTADELLASMDQDPNTAYRALTGRSLDDLYLCGGNGNIEYTIVHWNGTESRKLLPPRPQGLYTYTLTDIVRDGEGDLWSCGMRGALLRGDASRGVAQVPGVDAGFDGDPPFYRLALWRDAVWLAGGEALYRYRDGVLSEVPLPDPALGRGLHTVEAAGDVLWACSLDAIARFDGRDWDVIEGPGD